MSGWLVVFRGRGEKRIVSRRGRGGGGRRREILTSSERRGEKKARDGGGAHLRNLEHRLLELVGVRDGVSGLDLRGHGAGGARGGELLGGNGRQGRAGLLQSGDALRASRQSCHAGRHISRLLSLGKRSLVVGVVSVVGLRDRVALRYASLFLVARPRGDLFSIRAGIPERLEP